MDWSPYYPSFVLETPGEETNSNTAVESNASPPIKQLKQDVEVADIGCGFGGLLVALAPLMPDTLLLGL